MQRGTVYWGLALLVGATFYLVLLLLAHPSLLCSGYWAALQVLLVLYLLVLFLPLLSACRWFLKGSGFNKVSIGLVLISFWSFFEAQM